MKAAALLPIPCLAMIRPRPGDFRFSKNDVDVMLEDIDAVKQAGLSGVVLGAQHATDGLDGHLLKELCDRAAGLTCTLHRVIDVIGDPLQAIEQAIELGFDRVLTSGGQPRAVEGLKLIQKMNESANGRIVVMPGSGLRASNVHQVLALGVAEVHASCSVKRQARSSLESLRQGEPLELNETSEKQVRAMRDAVDSFALHSSSQ